MKKTVEAFPAIWYSCPECNADNTIRLCLTNPAQATDTVCCQCKHRWDFTSMAHALFEKHGFEPFSKNCFHPATDFICDECGRNNTVINPIHSQHIEPVDPEDEEETNFVAIQECDEVNEGTCRYCGTTYRLVMELPEQP